jgi:hypothetical protein
MMANENLLKELRASPLGVDDVLRAIAGQHMGLGRPAEFRTQIPERGGVHFPHSGDVLPLLGLLFNAIDRLWRECASVSDDLHVAAFAGFGLLHIHPFENANSRTALELMKLLLMKRWNWQQSPVTFPSDDPAELGVIHAIDATFEKGPLTQESLVAKANKLARRFNMVTLKELRADAQLHSAAEYLFICAAPSVRAAAAAEFPQA